MSTAMANPSPEAWSWSRTLSHTRHRMLDQCAAHDLCSAGPCRTPTSSGGAASNRCSINLTRIFTLIVDVIGPRSCPPPLPLTTVLCLLPNRVYSRHVYIYGLSLGDNTEFLMRNAVIHSFSLSRLASSAGTSPPRV